MKILLRDHKGADVSLAKLAVAREIYGSFYFSK